MWSRRVFRLLRDMVTLFTLSLSKERVACRISTELMWLRFTNQLLPMRKKLDGCPITSDPLLHREHKLRHDHFLTPSGIAGNRPVTETGELKLNDIIPMPLPQRCRSMGIIFPLHGEGADQCVTCSSPSRG